MLESCQCLKYTNDIIVCQCFVTSATSTALLVMKQKCSDAYRSWENKKRSEKINVLLRALVITCLAFSCVLAGYFPYAFFRALEHARAIQEYDAVVIQTEKIFQESLSNKVESLRLVESIMRSTCPEASTWPNCTVTPAIFDTMSDSLTKMADMSSVGVSALIPGSDDQARLQFEQYVSQVYIDAGLTFFGAWTYPNSTVRGVSALDENGTIIHGTSAPSYSEFGYLAPVYQLSGVTTSAGAAGAILYNLASEYYRVEAIEDALRCYQNKSENSGCGRITDVIFPELSTTIVAPVALIMYPIEIENEIPAIAFSSHLWGNVIEYSVPSYVDGLDIVIRSSDTIFTYTFEEGSAGQAKHGDQHDSDYDYTKYFFVADIVGPAGLYYTVSIYASSSFFNDFRDNRAIYASIIGVAISVITSFLFFVYDFFLSRSARENAVILATKRAFVRYISHEIRTPLNTVNIGLKVLMQELQDLPSRWEAWLKSTAGATGSEVDSSSSVAEEVKRKQGEMVDLVKEIEESSDAAVGILNDLINYDKIAMNKMVLELQAIEIWEFVRQSFSPFLLQARQKSIDMSLELECDENDNVSQPQPQQQAAPGSVTEVKPSKLIVVGDAIKLTQVMRNLLSNAIKFTPNGGSIVVKAKWVPATSSQCYVHEDSFPQFSRAGAIAISVQDTGAGISPENQRLLFQEGRQFNANRLQGGGGSGLGLFIAKGVVTLHGGKLSLRSEGEGCGSTFTLLLPAVSPPHTPPPSSPDHDGEVDLESGLECVSLQLDVPSSSSSYSKVDASDSSEVHPDAPDAHESAPQSQSQKRQHQHQHLHPMKAPLRNVMVVDDSAPSRKMLCRLLTNAGYKCTQARDGQQCVDLMLQNREENASNSNAVSTEGNGNGSDSDRDDDSGLIQIVFMDYEMPILNGPDATRCLREHGFTIPIVGVTGNVLPVDKDLFRSKGADDVLSKPLHLDDFKQVIAKLFPCVDNSDDRCSNGSADKC